MCGIIGCVGNRRKSLQEAYRFVSHGQIYIEARGPDRSQIINLPANVASIGMATLSINNPSQHYGPYCSTNRRYVLTYNGEIYNGRDLCQRFDIWLSPIENDAHLLLKLFEKVGTKCLPYINGMFAFAILDTQLNRLTLAVDKHSQKPLYWTKSQNLLAFSSVYTALAQLNTEDQSFSDEFLEFENFVGGRTPSSGIHKLKGGTFAEYTPADDRLRIAEYSKVGSPQAGTNVADSLVSAAGRLATSLPSALLLSGGIDSAILAALLRPNVAVTVSFDEHDAYSEEVKAREICDAFGIEHVVIKPDSTKLLTNIDDITRRLQFPIGNASVFPEYVIYEELAKRGIRVCYSGLGADEFFLGYERMRLFVAKIAGKTPAVADNYLPLQQHLNSIYDPQVSPGENYLRLLARNPSAKLSHVAIPEELNSVDQLSELMTWIETEFSLPGLLRTTDALSGSFGIEVRAPYLDDEVIAAAGQLQLWDKLDVDNGTKLPLRRLAANLGVPMSVTHDLVKRGFAAPYGMWLGTQSKARGIFDRSVFLSALIESHQRLNYPVAA